MLSLSLSSSSSRIPSLFTHSCRVLSPQWVRPTYSMTEHEPRAGYRRQPLPRPTLTNVREGWKLWPKVWRNTKEVIADYEVFSGMSAHMDHLDYRYFANFRSMPAERLNEWMVITEKDHDEGFSTATVEKHPTRGTALFHGNLNTTPVQRGDLARAGYATLRSPRRTFLGTIEVGYRLRKFTHMVVRYRGDGRPYLFMLRPHPRIKFDFHMYDLHTYALFTRGGPYWQTAKIPLSKFFFGYRGRIQDKQHPFTGDAFRELVITLQDNHNGPFCLELDFIGFLFDKFHHEEFAYEKYATSSKSKLFY